MFPSVQEIPISTGSPNIVLTCNLPECVWMISNDSDFISIDSYVIPELTDSYSKIFSLVRMTSSGVTGRRTGLKSDPAKLIGSIQLVRSNCTAP